MKPSERVTIKAFLAVDQASVSGVAMGLYADRLRSIRTGVATKPEHRVQHIKAALALAGCTCFLGAEKAQRTYPEPCKCGAVACLFVVLEDHSLIPASAGMGTPTLLGMGAARGAWEETLAHFGHKDAMRDKVDMGTWRGAVLGPRFARARKEVVKPEAVRWAKARTRREDIGDDEAEALCILTWAADAIPQKIAVKRLQQDLFEQHGLQQRGPA